MKGVRDRNLYYLKGSTVTGALTASVDSDDDNTKLCHIRLDHAVRSLCKPWLSKAY